MDVIDQSAVQTACRGLLRPIASFLLKCGMTWREFSAISKSVFVEVAGIDYGIKGRPTNVSRVSLLTGISRKEVSKLRQQLEQNPADGPESKTTDATRVLSGWHLDPDFSDNGQPRVLTQEGDGASFAALCRRYAGDIPTIAMLKELKRVGAVTEHKPDELTVVHRYYMPTAFDPQWIMNAGGVFADLGNNINFNVAAEDGVRTRFLGRATDPTIDASAIPEFYEFIETHGQPFLELVDEWLTAHRSKEGDRESGHPVRLGVGLFLIQDD